MSSQLLLGLDIGGTKSAVVVGDGDGHAMARETFPTAAPEPTIARLIALGGRLCSGEHPAAVGITCGSPLSSSEGLILSPPNLPGWDRVPVVKMVHDAFHVPTVLENDANAAAVAEWRWGLEGKVDDLVYLTCGTGNGAGIILGGRLLRGKQDMAGEIGHVRLLETGPVGYHKAGSIEGLTSGRALGELAKLRLEERHDPSHLDTLSPKILTGRDVCVAAIDGDAFAMKVVREQADYLGRACAILIDILNPQRISLGGTALQLGDLLLDGVREAAKREAIPAAFEACTIDKAVLGDRIQDLAALAAAGVAFEGSQP
jgi:glucokinase